MSLENEAQSAIQSTKSFYKEYISGMTRERLGKEFHADSDRLIELYKEATGEEIEKRTGKKIPIHIKILRLMSTIANRLNPTRRLVFGLSIIGFIVYHLTSGIFAELLLPASFFAMILLLMIELLEKSDFQREIDLARNIQLSLLPSSKSEKGNLEISSFANTAKEVGGDYVDVIENDSGTYVVIADVSGKGLSAALYMVRMQALVHLLIEKEKPDPKELLIELNDYVKSGIKDKTFVTACVGFFPKEKPYFMYARAGHNPPVYFNRKKDSVFQLRSDGFALGMTTNERLEKQLVLKKIRFEEGDTVLFYTDGLTEARNDIGEEYGIERIESILDIYGSLHSKTIVGKIQASLETFIGDEAPGDDITFTCVHRPSSD